jgi:hypothetical protein
MKRALAALLALLPATAALATSITPAPPHDPKLGCKAIKQVIADLNAGRLRDPKLWHSGPTFFSDAFGKVETGEESAFLHFMRHSEGRPDPKPIRLYRVWTLLPDKDDPVYLVGLEREVWREKRMVDDGMMNMQEVDDPHYETDTSSWLVSFWSNRIIHFREVPEMYRFWTRAKTVKDCYEY